MTRTPHNEKPTPVPLARGRSSFHALSIPERAGLLGGRDLLSPAAHRVQFYETDAFLLEVVGDFLGAGLGTGAACIVIATPAHRDGLAQRLQSQGVDLPSAQTLGKYVALDAAETLAQFLVAGTPDPQRFRKVIGGLIERAAKGRPPVRVFGEMVALLWAEGNQTAAVELEALWEELRSTASAKAVALIARLSQE